MLKDTQQSSYSTLQPVPEGAELKESRFSPKCMLFTAMGLLALFFLGISHANSKASNNSDLQTSATSIISSDDSIIVDITAHICDTQYNGDYFIQLITTEGISESQPILSDMNDNSDIALSVALTGLGTDIDAITIYSTETNPNNALCVNSIRASIGGQHQSYQNTEEIYIGTDCEQCTVSYTFENEDDGKPELEDAVEAEEVVEDNDQLSNDEE